MRSIAAILIVLVATSAYGACDNLYPHQKVIAPLSTLELCNSFFVTRYDAEHKANIFSSALVTPKSSKVVRSNDFHPDLRIDATQRAEVHDYANTGFDKGHVTPAGDASTIEQMHDTFLMSNMTPQFPTLNRVSWRELEMNVRLEIKSPTYVLTGSYYEDFTHTIKNGIPIPSGYYKVVYFDPAVCYWADNKPSEKVKTIDCQGLIEKINIDFLH